jgi:hypothetical protein
MESLVLLVERFEAVPDPRISRSKRHNLIDIIAIVIVGVVCNAESWEEIELIAETMRPHRFG